MRNNRFLLIFISSLFILGCSQDKEYEVYLCSNRTDSISCTDSCKKNEKLNFTFIVNKEKSSVLSVTYLDGVQKESTTLNNCSIFNEKNWDCLKNDKDNSEMETISKMTNGIYSYSNVVKFNGKEIHSTYACGK